MSKEKKSKLSPEEAALPGLTGGQKCAYAIQDFGCSIATGLVTSFGMLYWGNVAHLNLGVIGTLILISKILDGVTDVIAGTIIDRTKSKHGKARVWMMRTLPFILVFLIAMFMIPSGIPEVAQYAFLFITYTVFNDVLFTMNNIAFSTLAVRCTRRESDKVQIGVLRFVFSTIAGIVMAAATSAVVDAMGGGVSGWRNTAILYAVIFGLCQLITLLRVPELPDENAEQIISEANPFKQIASNLICLIRNKYFLFHLANMVLFTLAQMSMSSSGIYYMTYVYGNAAMFGTLSATTVALVVGLAFVPMMTQKLGTRNTILSGMILATAMGALFWLASVWVNLPLMIITNILRWFGSATFIGTATVVIPSKISEYSMLRDNVNIEATVFSCVSMGTKIGSGIAAGMVGWLLNAAGYIAVDGATQPATALNMMTFLYAAAPFIALLIVLVFCYFQKVENAVEKLKTEKA